MLRRARVLPLVLAEFALDEVFVVSGGGVQSSEPPPDEGSANGFRMSTGRGVGADDIGAKDSEGTLAFDAVGASHTLPAGPPKLIAGSCEAARAEEALPFDQPFPADAPPNIDEP